MKKENIWKILYIISLIMYGTTGCLAKFINIPTGLLIFLRALIGTLFILLFMSITKKKMNKEIVKKNLLWLVLGGASIGINWICLFEAYNYTEVSHASLINYLAPALFILVAPFILKERFSPYKLIFVFLALVGVLLVSGIFENGSEGTSVKGTILAIFASLGYVGILVFNKLQHDVPSFDKVVVELSTATIITLPYALITTSFSEIVVDYKLILLVLLFSIILTGVAYILYLGSMEKLSSINIAIFSYIEPVASVLLSVIILKEHLSVLNIIGGVLIIGSTLAYDLIKIKNKKEDVKPNDELSPVETSQN